MTTFYNIGMLLVVRDPYTYEDVLCVVLGIGTVNVFEDSDDVLYHGFSLSHNNPYFFFGSDVICRIEEH